MAATTATAVVDALAANGLAPFVVGRSGTRLEVGLEGRPRIEVVEALRAGLPEGEWYVGWQVGNRRHLTALAATRSRRLARAAHTWTIFQLVAAGRRAIGPEAAVELTFWDRGTSGQLEQIGTRATARFDARSAATVETIDTAALPGRSAFPMARNLEHFEEPIDVVVTWVDGDDPEWRAAFDRWNQSDESATREARDWARFRSRDELRYALRSIWWHCPWVRTIHLVTAGHRPAWLQEHPALRVVAHTDILPADVLPTFNSHAIESALHHIDGLAEHFVYFNDDMFVGRPVTPELFFTSAGLMNVFLSDARIPGFEDAHTLGVDVGAIRTRELVESALRRVPTRKPHHSPYSLTRSVMGELESVFPDAIARTRAARFRSATDVSTAASLAQHFAVGTGRGVLADVRTEYVTVESHRLAWHLRRIALGRDFDTFCINATQDRGAADATADAAIDAFLADYFPLPAPWERQ